MAAWRSGEESARGYCAKRGLSLSSLRYWSGRLRSESSGQALNEAFDRAPVRLAKVRKVGAKKRARKKKAPTAESPKSAREPSAEVPVVMVAGEVRLELRRGFSPETLKAVLDVVASGGGER